MRAYLYVPSTSMPSWVTVLHIEEGGVPYDYTELRLRDGELEVASDVLGVVSTVRGGPIPFDRWACVELRLAVSATGEVELFVDDVSTALETAINTVPTGTYRSLFVGISHRNAAQTGTVETYFDEVVLSRTRVGCD